MKPKIIIADVLVLKKLHEALATLNLNNSVTILTLIRRETNYPLVSELIEDDETRGTDNMGPVSGGPYQL